MLYMNAAWTARSDQHAAESKAGAQSHHANERSIGRFVTRAELIAAVEEAHAALHEVADLLTGEIGEHTFLLTAKQIERAYEALHSVGAGGTAPPDREQRAARKQRAPVPFTTEEGWAFEEQLQAEIASYPGATFEERLSEMAAANPWMNEDLVPASSGSAKARRRLNLDIAKQVEPLRRSLGLTQAQAAARMGVARTTVVAIEQGKLGVREEHLAALRVERHV